MLGLGSAIHYLHMECDQCIMHGDIKPASITSRNCNLSDFGLARLLDHGVEQEVTLTRSLHQPISSYLPRKRLLPETTASSSKHFATATAGAILDASIAVALCRGYVDDLACQGCIAAAFQDVLQTCP